MATSATALMAQEAITMGRRELPNKRSEIIPESGGYIEEDEVSAAPEAVDEARLRGFGPYRELLSNPRFHLASHVKGLENVVRYGLTTWVPIYYFEAGGLSIQSTILLTVLLPVGYLVAPPLSGIISDRLLGSSRRPMVIASCAISSVALVVRPCRTTLKKTKFRLLPKRWTKRGFEDLAPIGNCCPIPDFTWLPTSRAWRT